MSDLDEFGIPEEEWSLLTNALAEPVEQLIVVESKDPGQLREIERRLPELIGRRRLLRQAVDFNAMREPENVWKTAQSYIQSTNTDNNGFELTPSPHRGRSAWGRLKAGKASDSACPHPNPPPLGEGTLLELNSTVLTTSIPLLVVVMDVWPTPDDGEAVKQLVAFWRGMNQLREQWHSLPAQVLFLLSPAAYRHLSLNADHLKRWISLKLRMWKGSTDLEVLARPGSIAVGGNVHGNVYTGQPPKDGLLASEIYSAMLVRLLEEAIIREESKSDLVRRYYLPLITESLAMGERQVAVTWRGKIGDLEGLAQEEREALKKLDEQLAEPADKFRFDVFFSYNSQYRTIVRELASALQKRGLKVWLDEDQTALLDALDRSASAAVLIGKGGLSTWQKKEMLLYYFRDNRPIIPVLLPDAPKNLTLPPFLANRSWVDLRQGITESKIDQLVWGITGKKPQSSDRRSG